MIHPDPFGQDDLDTEETLELCALFTSEVIAQVQRDTNAVYGGWALTSWGFPFRLYAEQAERLQPLPEQDGPLPGHYDSAKKSPAWDELGPPFLVGGQWRAAYAHGHSVPLSVEERDELIERHKPALAQKAHRVANLGMDECGAFRDADMDAIMAALESKEERADSLADDQIDTGPLT